MLPTQDDLENQAAALGRALLARGWWLSTAESCTGGWVAQSLTAVAGSSAWFERGFVTYSNRAKQEMLGVPEVTLQNDGAVSEATVLAMARGALAHSPAQLSVAISGIAGPGGGSAAKPVGTVWFAWAYPDGAHADKRVFDGDREAVRLQAVAHALAGLQRLAVS